MGLLDNYFLNQSRPANQGLMQAAAAMLEASGPSRIPVSFGQGVSRGMLAGSQRYSQAAAEQLAREQAAELAQRQGLFRRDLMAGQFDTPAMPAQEATYGVDETPDGRPMDSRRQFELTPAVAATPASLNLQQAGEEQYKRGLLDFKDLISNQKYSPKAAKDPNKWREYLLAQTPQGGSFGGTFEDYVAISTNILVKAMAPLRGEQTRTLSHDDWVRDQRDRYELPRQDHAPLVSKVKGFTVNVGGKTYTFPDQKSANNFKLQAGVQ